MRGGDSDDEGLNLDRDEPCIEQWRHLRQVSTYNSSCREETWWMVIAPTVALCTRPVEDRSKILYMLERGDPIYCVHANSTWLQVDPYKRPEQKYGGAHVRTWHERLQATLPQRAWVMWNGAEKGLGTLAMPVPHLDKLLQYSSTNVTLPHEAIGWSMSEVDVFLGSLGFVRPGRESAMLRSTKKLIRAVRGGAMGLEYRVDEHGVTGGVFACGAVAKGSYVEVCPLLEVDPDLRRKSPLLKRITLNMPGAVDRFGIVLGFAKVYMASKTPNLHWSYRGDDEVVLWAAQEVHVGNELTVDFSAPAQPLDKACQPPATWQAPISRGPNKLQTAGYVVHGNSGIHGRGVFSTRDAAAGDLLESCPAFALDQAGAEAMFSYRWGLKESESDYFIPMGMGSLYNHSEKPNARGSLDVKRSVLEFIATEDLYKGQEILVSYGDTYFDEDFAGHRKSELLHIEAPQTDGDLHLQKLVELQRALIRAFEAEEFKKELRRRAAQRQRLVGQSNVSKKIVGNSNSIHSLVMGTQMPILERFGYPHGMQGALKMQEDLGIYTIGLDEWHEAVQNNVRLTSLIHMYDPPPQEYWEVVPIQLTILGTEENEKPEVFQENVPRKAPCGYVRFMLSVRFPQTGAYSEGNVQLAGGSSATSFYLHNDSDPLPPSGHFFVSGIGDAWPATQQPESEETTEGFTEWQIVWRWLMDLDAQRSARNFGASTFKIAGTWDNYKCNEMIWDGHSFVYYVTLSEQRWESFQILLDGHWETTLYPDARDGSPWDQHALMGPDNKGHGKNWTLGRHAGDAGDPGTQYKVELKPDERGLPGSVVWERLPTSEEAEKARALTRYAAEWAASELQKQQILQKRKQAKAAQDFRKEWQQRQEAKAAAAALG